MEYSFQFLKQLLVLFACIHRPTDIADSCITSRHHSVYYFPSNTFLAKYLFQTIYINRKSTTTGSSIYTKWYTTQNIFLLHYWKCLVYGMPMCDTADKFYCHQRSLTDCDRKFLRPFQGRCAIACARAHTRAKVFRRVISCMRK